MEDELPENVIPAEAYFEARKGTDRSVANYCWFIKFETSYKEEQGEKPFTTRREKHFVRAYMKEAARRGL